MPDWFTAMTGRHAYRTKPTFGSWAMWGGPQWGPMWFNRRAQGAAR